MQLKQMVLLFLVYIFVYSYKVWNKSVKICGVNKKYLDIAFDSINRIYTKNKGVTTNLNTFLLLIIKNIYKYLKI